MNALKLDTVSAVDGTLVLRLPEPGLFRVHVEATWTPVEPDRKAMFDAVHRRGHPDAVALLERFGEGGIANIEVLLAWGSVDDPTLERPPQPALVEREPIP
jgi:hypothetical protein